MCKKLYSIFLLLVAGLSNAQTPTDFFNFSSVHDIHLTFSQANYWDTLVYYKSLDDAGIAQKYLPAQVIINNDTIDSVGVRLRGNASYGHPGTKKPIQLDFNEFISGQKYWGLKKLNLNNSYLDPTQIREKLFLDVLQEEGMQAPRCTFAAVYINGTYVGLYKALETINNEFLDDHFGNKDGNLFKCEPSTPLTWEGYTQSSYYDNFELRTNTTANDWTDVINFMDVVNHTSVSNYPSSLNTVFNTDAYLKAWAANNLFGNLDSYLYLPHNYYLYHNTSSDKMEWVTWDVSLAFGVYALLVVPDSKNFDVDYLPNNAIVDRPLNYYCLENENLRQKYLNNICHFMQTSFFPSNLYPRIDSLANVIRPYVNAEPSSNQMFTTTQFEQNLDFTTVSYSVIGQVPGLKAFINERRSNVSKQLCNRNWSCLAGEEIASGEVVKIYPNPGETINIELIFGSEFSNTLYTIYDVSGQQAASFSLEPGTAYPYTIKLNTLREGIYFMNVQSGCKSEKKKIVVIRE